VAGSRRSSAALAAICAFVVAVGTWNVVRYPPGLGYDAPDHIGYADGLIPGWRLPHGTGEYYTPPGYYALAGSLDWLTGKIGAGGTHRAAMAVDVLFVLGTVLLVRLIVREAWPGRDRIALGACAFVALLPRTVEMEAMFHPATMALFFCTLALWLCLRTFDDRRYAVALGVALGAAQLVLAAALWTVVAVAAALALARRWRSLVIALALAVVIPLPWYVHQQLTYSGPAPLPRPATPQARAGGVQSGKPKPIWERRPARFYVDPGLPDAITRPYRPHFVNLALPTTYTELWGDYFGHWSWNFSHQPRPPSGTLAQLRIQSLVGILPTALAVVGWVALLVGSVRVPRRLALVLLPALGLLGYLYIVVSYPTPDGNILKGSYMLTTLPAWALAFGYALDRLRGRLWPVALAVLAVCAVAELPFLVY
jgi:hypothetical protein